MYKELGEIHIDAFYGLINFHDVQVYTVDRKTPDSAAAATAFLAGVKAQLGTLGVNQNVAREDCEAVKGNEMKSLIHYAMDEGMQSLTLHVIVL